MKTLIFDMVSIHPITSTVINLFICVVVISAMYIMISNIIGISKNKKKHRRIILVGKMAAGKDYMKSIFTSKGFTQEVSYTSRKPRPGEMDGSDYIFITKHQFEKFIKEDFFKQYVLFGGNYYGTSKLQWNTKDVFIMTPSGVANLTANDRKDSFVMYIDVPQEIRIQRLHKRNMTEEEIADRIKLDEMNFDGYTDYDIKINQDF